MWLLLAQVQAPTDPVSYTPLTIVAIVVWALLRRMKDTDEEKDKRITTLETQLESMRKAKDDEISEQRRLKHQAINRYAAAEGTLHLAVKLAKSCSCHALDPIENLLPKE